MPVTTRIISDPSGSRRSENGTVSVIDSGQGISEAEREVIFQRFWRRDRRQAGGAGLGLSIVKRVVEAHGGTIAIDDRSGGGTRFSLSFVRA